MNTTSRSLSLMMALSLSSLFWQPLASADVIDYHRMPNAFIQAERALKRGNSERVINLMQQRNSNQKHSAHDGKRFELMCKAHYQQQRYEKAESFCNMAVTAEQTNWNHYNNRGVMFYKMARYNEALNDFKHAASIMLTASNKQKWSIRRNIAAAELSVQEVSAR